MELRVSTCPHPPAMLAEGMPSRFRRVPLECSVPINSLLRKLPFWPPSGLVYLRLLAGTNLRS